MARYSIKMLKDENGNPFVPLVNTEGIKNNDGESLDSILSRKLEASNIKAGSNITINEDNGNITINSTGCGGGSSTVLIDNLTTSEPNQGALDARQGKILKDSIPQVINNLTTVDTNNALSAYQGYLLDHKFNDYATIGSLAKIATTGKAEDVYFKDGDNIQDKYDTGELSKKYYILDDLPIGAQFAYSSATNIPEGCLICDGSAVSRTDYSELFTVIGISYGEGDGSTTFNLPNKRGRVSVGVDDTQDEFNILGKNGGSKFLQEHIHPLFYSTNETDGGDLDRLAPITVKKSSSGRGTFYTRGAGSSNTNIPVGEEGNLQPYQVDIWLIKAKQRATNILPNAAIYDGLDSTSTTNALSANMGNVLNNKFKNNMGNITVESINSKNLFNKNNVVLNYYLGYNDGQPIYDTNMCYTNYYIEVTPGDKYTMSNTSATQFTIHYYDANKNWLDYNNQNNNLNSYTVTVIDNAKYIRLACGKSVRDSIQFEKGSKATEYTNYKSFGIIESGNNTNGNWVKFSDGTMICYKKIVGKVDINNSWGSLYQNSIDLGSSPQTFLEVPVINYSMIGEYAFLGGTSVKPTNSNLGTIVIIRPTLLNNVPYEIDITAIGRWK